MTKDNDTRCACPWFWVYRIIEMLCLTLAVVAMCAPEALPWT